MIGRVEPLPSWHPDFSDWLKDVLRRHDSSLSAVKSAIHRSTAYGNPASFGQLDSIHAGRRRVSPQHLLQIADAIGAPDEFPDYKLCQVLYYLDRDAHDDDEVMRRGADLAAYLPASATRRAKARARREAERPRGTPRASPATPAARDAADASPSPPARKRKP